MGLDLASHWWQPRLSWEHVHGHLSRLGLTPLSFLFFWTPLASVSVQVLIRFVENWILLTKVQATLVLLTSSLWPRSENPHRITVEAGACHKCSMFSWQNYCILCVARDCTLRIKFIHLLRVTLLFVMHSALLASGSSFLLLPIFFIASPTPSFTPPDISRSELEAYKTTSRLRIMRTRWSPNRR